MALTDKIKAIADAIRTKTGTTDIMTLDEMPAKISGISGVAKEPYIEETYDADGYITHIKMVGQTVVRPYGFAYIGASLTQIDLPVNITSIGMWAFVNDVYLRLTELPSGLTVIGANAFNNCSEISITEIPSGVTSIGPNAFIDCVGLTSIRFLGTPTSINATAFRNCTNIKEIKVPWSEGAVANAPWGAINATITYDYTGE